MEAWVYCDESGNSGINYLDPESPFLVLGGFIVAGDARAKAEDAVRAFVDELALPSGLEPKFKSVWRASRQGKTIELFKALGRAGVIPLFYFMQKLYAVAGKIVDVFLDPAHNPGAVWLPTTALRHRARIVDFIYTASNEVLRGFAEAYRDPSKNRVLLESCLEQLLRLAESNGEQLLTRGFRGALDSLSMIIAREDYEEFGAGRHGDYASLNVPALMQFMRKCDMVLDMFRPTRGTFIHDEQGQFKLIFADFVRLIQAVGVGDRNIETVLARENMHVDRIGIRNIHCFDMRDSKSEPLLLAADILAGGVARVLRRVHDKEPWSERERDLASLILPSMLGNREAVSAYYADENFVTEALGRLL